MRFLLDYIKSNIKWISIYLFLEVVMVAILMLNSIRNIEIAYAIAIISFIAIVTIVIDIIFKGIRYRKLLDVEKELIISLDGLPKYTDMIEEKYQELLFNMKEGYSVKEREYLSIERELNEYYALWVHQIKTPIAALRLLLQEKERSELTDSELLTYSGELEEVFRIEQYVEMALAYIRLGSESSDYVIEELALDSVIRSAIRKYAKLFIGKGLKLEYDGCDNRVTSDGKLLTFVIEQILSNAIKYTKSGSVCVGVLEDDSKTSIVISDSGIGIKSEDLPRVIEKGFTGYNGHSDNNSSGIGLYLCKKMLDKLGHGLSIESEIGVGTTVSIIINKD